MRLGKNTTLRNNVNKQNHNKPPYRVPSMADIRMTPFNGYSLVSTFSGCGGSCLGFEMAGFKVLWASEFIEAARDVYRLNHPDVILDGNDIRQVHPEEILSVIGKKRGEIDVLEGSPPCAAFSTAGKREAGWGKVRNYSDTKQRVDDLFFEFCRILDGLQPKMFVAENVSGLVKGVAKGYFIEIIKALKDCGYNVKCQVLDAQWLGVPQMRQRVIFMGVRNDLKAEPEFPKPMPWRYSVREAIPWIDRAEEDTGGDFSYGECTNGPTPTVRAGGVGHLKAISSIMLGQPDYAQKIGNSFPKGTLHPVTSPSPTVMGTSGMIGGAPRSLVNKIRIAKGFDDEEWVDASSTTSPTIGAGPAFGCNKNNNGGKIEVISNGTVERRKFTIAELKRICSFPDDFVLTGTYAQQWERLGRAVPPLMMRSVAECICRMLEQIKRDAMLSS